MAVLARNVTLMRLAKPKCLACLLKREAATALLPHCREEMKVEV
jgi:hypothetical protein